MYKCSICTSRSHLTQKTVFLLCTWSSALLTQHAGFSLQQRQYVLVEEQRAEAEEVPERQVCQRPGAPDTGFGLDHRGLGDGDLQHRLSRSALAAGQKHSLRPRPEAVQRGPGPGFPGAAHAAEYYRHQQERTSADIQH